MHLSWLVRLCFTWVLLLKIIVVRCWVISRLSYLFILSVWFENLWLVNIVRTRSLA